MASLSAREQAYQTIRSRIITMELKPGDPLNDRELAEQMGISHSVLNEILNARRPVTEKTAMMFEAALGVDAEPLIRIQMRYNMRAAKKDQSFMLRLENIRQVAAML